MKKEDLYGLVMCGGKSTRMGEDKSKIVYHNVEQCYYVYNMLQEICTNVFMSCNPEQADTIDKNYSVIVDAVDFNNCGPIGGVLSAMSKHSEKDFLVIGCDYPLLNILVIKNFINTIPKDKINAAFYNKKENLYEPLLAIYRATSFKNLISNYKAGNYSLQKFLKSEFAFQFTGYDTNLVQSIDTPEKKNAVKDFITNRI